MKKFYSIALLAFLLSVASVYAQKSGMVNANVLPKKAQTFLNQYFKGVQVLWIERDWDEFEVNLNNGVEVDFFANGDWKEVDGKYTPIPTGFVPSAVMTAIANMYPQAAIIKIEKDWAGFDIELNNRMELKIGANGKVYEVEYDD